jgi:hypothetical protein
MGARHERHARFVARGADRSARAPSYDAIHAFGSRKVAQEYVDWQDARGGDHCYIVADRTRVEPAA